jgi:hypothetical protein
MIKSRKKKVKGHLTHIGEEKSIRGCMENLKEILRVTSDTAA